MSIKITLIRYNLGINILDASPVIPKAGEALFVTSKLQLRSRNNESIKKGSSIRWIGYRTYRRHLWSISREHQRVFDSTPREREWLEREIRKCSHDPFCKGITILEHTFATLPNGFETTVTLFEDIPCQHIN